MRLSFRPAVAGLVLAVLLGLAACDTAEQRAEGHYQRATALLAEGDVERAEVEFRNVFRLNGAHIRARLDYARLLRDRGEIGGAIAQYRRLVDGDRNHPDGHRELAALALQVGDFETAGFHADRALALAPADPEVRAIKASLDFRGGDREAAVATAEEVLADAPGNVLAHMVVIAGRMAAEDYPGALAQTDAALRAAPEEEGLHLARLAALEASGDMAGTGEQLRRMAALFPGNEGVTQALIQWHLRTEDPAGAEAVLREAAARHPDAPEGHLAIVQFLYEIEGPAAARAELERLVTTGADALPFRRALADLDFAEGRTAEAIAALRALREAEAPADDIRDIEVALAAMLRDTGDRTESAGLVTAVLEADPTHVGALKLRARAAVEEDRPEHAIRDMRTALGQAPEDPEIMTIMAMAHEREGRRELMGERLGRAVEASRHAPAESLRYAQYLMGEGRIGPAEGVLVDALRRAPEDPELLAMLGELHLERADWPRARAVAGLLRGLGDPSAADAAAGLEMASLQGEGRTDAAVALLEEFAAGGEGALGPRIALIRAEIEAGNLESAEARLRALLAEDPDSLPGRMMEAGLQLLKGSPDEAEALYRALLAERPDLAEPHAALYSLLAGQGRADEAAAALDAGIAATGGAPALRFAKAGLLEARGDFEGAITIYEALYAADTGDTVLANNLASLLAAHRDDPDSLERAFAVARRLRDAEVPAFQDTYGWILARRGDPEAALAYLEPAAASLTDDPLVQYHLGMAYHALGRLDDARAVLGRAVALAGEASPLPQIAAARDRLAELDAPASDG